MEPYVLSTQAAQKLSETKRMEFKDQLNANAKIYKLKV